jgi:uncharacterized membrane protein YhhN
MTTSRAGRPALLPSLLAGAFVVDAVVHLVVQLVGGTGALSDVTQDLLMPLLAATLLTATAAPRARLVRWAVVALGLSFLGDALPDLVSGDGAFLVMVGAFLLAQVAYVVAFWPFRASSVLRRPVLLLPYAVAFVALVAACREGAGPMLAPVVVYGAALVTMAVLSTGVSRATGAGGAVFLVSDALIALGEFTSLDLPAHGFWVMLTYVVGQALIVVGILGVVGTVGVIGIAGRGVRPSPGAQPPARRQGSRSSR